MLGCSVYHIGRIADYKGATGEIVTISDGHREARRLPSISGKRRRSNKEQQQRIRIRMGS